MKKFLPLLLTLCLLLSLFSCGARGDGEPSETPDETPVETPDETPDETPADNGLCEKDPPLRDGLTLLTDEMGEPSVGHYEFDRDGVAVAVDFWSVPRPWYGERLEGTLTYTNNTGTEISRYLHAYVELGSSWEVTGETVYYASEPRIAQSAELASVGEDAPVLVNLSSGETVTVNFSIEVPSDIKENTAFYDLYFGLYENEEPTAGEVKYLVYFVVHH